MILASLLSPHASLQHVGTTKRDCYIIQYIKLVVPLVALSMYGKIPVRASSHQSGKLLRGVTQLGHSPEGNRR